MTRQRRRTARHAGARGPTVSTPVLPPLSNRALRPEDTGSFNRLYNAVFSRQRTLEVCNWEFSGGPLGAAHQVGLFEPDGSLVGHWGLLPCCIRVGSALLKAGKTENTMLAQRYRGRGLYKQFEQECLNDAWRGGFEAVWATYSAAARAHMNAGYRSVGVLQQFYLPMFGVAETMARVLSMAIGHPRRQALRTLLGIVRLRLKCADSLVRFQGDATLRCAPYQPDTVSKLLAQWDADLSSRSLKEYSVTIERTLPYLRWRFLDNPCVSYRFHTFVDETDNPIGYVIWRHKGPYVVIEDFILRTSWLNRPGLRKVLRCMVSTWRCEGVLCVRCTTLAGSRLSHLLLEAGFVPWRHRLPPEGTPEALASSLLLVTSPCLSRELTEALHEPSNWFLTRIVGEGVV